MLDKEGGTTRLEMGVGGKTTETLNQRVIGGVRVGVGSRAGIVHSSENARGSLLLDKIAHNLVVEKVDGGPLNALSDVLLLLGLEGQFNKDLLQLLVDIVNAELLERVLLKNLESVNIQNADSVGVSTTLAKGDVDTTDDPLEEVVVDSLAKSVPDSSSLVFISESCKFS
jgi:hypothetical protein